MNINLVACDIPTAAEIGAACARWLARTGKEFDDENIDDLGGAQLHALRY
jgi:hypothetical protein